MEKIGRFFRENWIRIIIAVVIGAVILLAYMLLHISSEYNQWVHPEYYRDGLFAGGISDVFIGILALLSFFGTFDIFTFYFKRKKKDSGYKENYGEYVERKRLERGHLNLFFLPYIIIGLLYISASLIIHFCL